MERDYHGELRLIFEQLKRMADCMEQAEVRAKRAEPTATEILELTLKMQRKLAQDVDDV